MDGQKRLTAPHAPTVNRKNRVATSAPQRAKQSTAVCGVRHSATATRNSNPSQPFSAGPNNNSYA